MIPDWFLGLPINLIHKYSIKHSVNPFLVAAIIRRESNGNPNTARFELRYNYIVEIDKHAKMNHITVETESILQKTSYGLMQLMGANARALGHTRMLTTLYQPEVNLHFGTKFLSGLYRKYGNEKDIIASYNAGSPRFNDDGSYVNQEYVDKVLKYYNEL